MRFRDFALLLFLVLSCCVAGRASETPTERAANAAAAQEMATAPLHGNLPDYSLPPDTLVKAQHMTAVRDDISYAEIVWGILQLVLLLWLGGIAWMRDTAVRASASRWVQGFVFVLLFWVAGFVLNLPIMLYGHHLSLQYGLSIQGWPGWFWDQAKNLAVIVVTAWLIVMLLFAIIRKAPRMWWVVFWAVSIPLALAGTYATPYVYDPLFHKFEPLQATHPQLVAQLEKVVVRGNMNIPPERMFLMKASEKTTTMNAYVTGFGGSKRMVVWDTTLAKATPDEVLVIFGHESGHYVLGHIATGIAFTILSLLLLLYLGYRFVGWAIARFGGRWRIPSQDDWGALAVLMLAFSLLNVVGGPIANAYSRHDEHAADVYGQEAVHGIVANPQEAARGAFAALGANYLEEPNPSPLSEFLFDNHPATGRRAAFAAHYDPWAEGAEPKYFRK